MNPIKNAFLVDLISTKDFTRFISESIDCRYKLTEILPSYFGSSFRILSSSVNKFVQLVFIKIQFLIRHSTRIPVELQRFNSIVQLILPQKVRRRFRKEDESNEIHDRKAQRIFGNCEKGQVVAGNESQQNAKVYR